MAFRLSPISALRMTEPDKYQAKLRKAITKHRGNMTHVAQDLDVGISTLKRWVAADAAIQRFIQSAREAA